MAPSHVYPVLGVGSTPGSAELVLIARVCQTKKEVHRIPYKSQMFSSFALWFPMFAGQLPDTSVTTMHKLVPHIKVGTWQQWSVGIRKQFLSWQDTNVSLWQGQVADNVTDAQLSSIVASLSREDFIKYVSKPVSVNTSGIRVKMSVLYIFYAVYAQWAHQDGQLPLYNVPFDGGKSCVEDCPLKID